LNSSDKLLARRAIEALRSGVPNRDSVRELPAFQGDITQRFAELVRQMQEEPAAECARSMCLSGGFGSGKSHLLEYLRHEALEHGCVCSFVVISKETPLFDSLALVRTAVETAAAPGKAGRAVAEILFSEKRDSAEFVRFFQWVHQQPGILDRRLAALLKLLEEPPMGSDELVDKIAWEWSGYPMKVSDIRSELKKIGQLSEYQVKRILVGELGDHLWRFLPRLFHFAGYGGWVVLIDEVELMLRYGWLQRAKSYAQIARLAGVAKDFKVCGILPVFSVTDDFWSVAEQKDDPSGLPARLRERGRPGDSDLAREAEAGMKILQNSIRLRPAGEEELVELKKHVRRLHSEAFDWGAPPTRSRELPASSSIREHVKSWIADWDMALLYPDYRPEIVKDEVRTDFSEDEDLSRDEGSGSPAEE
jgi:hypothetical protein